MEMNSTDQLPIVTEIRIKQFRSIEDQGVSLRPLTVLVGGNSSGKSTLHYALRMLVQAQQLQASTYKFPLNGPVISLGEFDEIKHFSPEGNSEHGVISFGVTFEQGSKSIQASEMDKKFSRFRNIPFEPDSSLNEFSHVSVDIDFVKSSRAGESGAIISEIRVVLTPTDTGQMISSFNLSNIGLSSFQSHNNIDAQDVFESEAFEKENQIVESISGNYYEDDDDAQVVSAVTLRGGIPFKFYQNQPLINAISSGLLAAGFQRKNRSSRRFGSGGTGRRMSYGRTPQKAKRQDEGLFDFLMRRLDEVGPEIFIRMPDLGTIDFGRRIERILGIDQFDDDELREFDAEFEERGHLLFLNRSLSDGGWSQNVTTPFDGVDVEILNNLTQYLQKNISFLDGVRHQGNEISSYGTRGLEGDIGISAQFLTHVLYQSKSTSIVSCPGKEGVPGVVLSEALNHWVERFEFGTSVDVKEQAGFGYRKEIVPLGLNKPVSLRAVGVGVDHAIPVIVRVLLSKPGETVVIEQPEIHLHPDAQLVMADFLISAAKTGRRLIVETHSELFALRIRRRVAEAKGAEKELLKQTVGFVFAVRDAKTAASRYENVEMTDDGGFEVWPEGFFDQQGEEAMEILKVQLGD